MALSPGDFAALHAPITFPILAFIPLLLLKYNNEDVSPFDDHSFIMLAFYLAIILYAIAMVTEIMCRIREAELPRTLTNIYLLCGPLAEVLLVFIPYPYVGWSLFGLWTIWFLYLALGSYRELSQSQLLAQWRSRLWDEDKLSGQNDDNHDHHSSASPSHDNDRHHSVPSTSDFHVINM